MLRILLIAAALVATAVVGLVLLIRAGLNAPLQDVPVAAREWGRVAVAVRQMNRFELGRPGRTEYFLVAAAAERIGRCPEAASDAPSFAATSAGGTLRVELKPALTGGRCGRRSFEGSSGPDDPRALDIALPDLEKTPTRVVFSQAGRTAEYLLRADRDKIVLEKAADPTDMVAPRHAALKRLPRTLFLAVGADRSPPSLWGGSIRLAPADGGAERRDALGDPVQYCRAPAPYRYASGAATVDGREVRYVQGVSESTLDDLYRQLAAAEKEAGAPPGFTLYALGLDGALEKRP